MINIKHYNFITIPIIVFTLSVFACLRLLQYYEKTWEDEHKSNLNKIALTQSVYLTRHLEKTLSAAYILGSIVKQNNGIIDDFEVYAHDIYESIGNIDNLQLAPNGIIEKVYPLEGHEKAIGHNILSDVTRNKEALLAIKTKQLSLAGPFELVQGGTAIIGRYPIYLNKTIQNADSFWGFSSVLIYLNELLSVVGFDEVMSDYEYQLSRSHPDTGNVETFSGSSDLKGFTSDPYRVAVPNGEWLLKISKLDSPKHPPLYYFAAAATTLFPLIAASFLFFLIRQPMLLSELVGIKTKELKQLALYDSLTGLVNRYEFERCVTSFISNAKANNAEHALCYMDLDQFKVINDTCGHAAGDELLRQICQEINKVIRQSDTFARLGGDEFGILMGNCSLENAYRVAESVWQIVQDYEFVWEGSTFKVGVSIGLVEINSEVTDLASLMSRADTACYSAKDAGRNRIHVFKNDDVEISERQGEMQWVSRIHHALENDLFCLYAQQIQSLTNSTEKYYELLIRLEDEGGNIIAPGEFLPAAERYNLMEKIDRWVINHSFDLLKSNPSFLNEIKHISINLSGQSLTNNSFLALIIEKLQDNEIPPEKICFEITETAAIHNLTNAIQFIESLKGLGCRFALDDFGSGLSSFAYLKTLPVDYLKIDGMFVKDMANDPIDCAMVKSINEIGQLMNMKTIAEFVENTEILEILKDIGVDYAQGYGISKPVCIKELL